MCCLYPKCPNEGIVGQTCVDCLKSGQYQNCTKCQNSARKKVLNVKNAPNIKKVPNIKSCDGYQNCAKKSNLSLCLNYVIMSKLCNNLKIV